MFIHIKSKGKYADNLYGFKLTIWAERKQPEWLGRHFVWRNNQWPHELWRDSRLSGWKSYMMQRGRKFHDLYKTVVQSHLEYYIQHKSSLVQRDTAESDRVQNKVTKMITAWKESSREMLACLKISCKKE